MTNSVTGWEGLKCPFFESVSRRILDPYFLGYGFKDCGGTSVGGVVYSRDRFFIEVSYEPETYPNYLPRILLGIGRSVNDSEWRLNALPLWFLVPSDRPESQFPFWSFETEEALVEVLNRMRTELLDAYVKPLWLDPIALHRKINAFKASSVQHA